MEERQGVDDNRFSFNDVRDDGSALQALYLSLFLKQKQNSIRHSGKYVLSQCRGSDGIEGD